MNEIELILPPGKKIYFASDFHLGSPGPLISLEREKIVIHWLETVRTDAHAIFILGDIFDFWFEYKKVIPKGFIRLQGKFMELTDAGIQLFFFSGNHDMWMYDYFPSEFGIPVFYEPRTFIMGHKKFLIGHGDGLGPGDRKYKLIKKVFRNPISQWIFRWIHPDLGISLANWLSKNSREKNRIKDQEFKGDQEWLLQYCRKLDETNPHHYYIFGHRHLPLDISVNGLNRYLNLGDWMTHNTYVQFDGSEARLISYKKNG